MAAQSHMVTHSHSGMPLHIQTALQEKRQDSEREEREGKQNKRVRGEGQNMGALQTKRTDGLECS